MGRLRPSGQARTMRETPNAGLMPVNINYVWGFSDAVAQTWVDPYVWLIGMMVGLPLLLFLPVHLLLSRFAPPPARTRPSTYSGSRPHRRVTTRSSG